MPGWVEEKAALVAQRWGAGVRRAVCVVAVVATVIAAVVVSMPGTASASTGTGPALLLNPGLLSQGLYAATSAQAASLADLEQQAITNTLSDHGLPASDAAAAATWGRPAAEAELWALLVQAIQTSAASRTTDQQNAVDWLAAVAGRQNIQSAEDAGLQYAKWAGIGASAYQNELSSNPSESALASFLSATAQPYTGGGSYSNPSASTNGGYCVYQAPAPDQSQYTANIYTTGVSATTPQTCFTPCTNVLGCSPPEPSYSQFVTWGTAQADSAFASPQYVATALGVTQGIEFGAAATGATAGIVFTSALAGALTGTLETALSSFTGAVVGGVVSAIDSQALVELAAGITGTELGGVFASVLAAIAIGVIASINLAHGLQLPGQLASLITSAQTAPPPDLATMLTNSGSALFGLFIGATQPAPLLGTCDNQYNYALNEPPCLNAPAIPAPSSSDITFTVAQKGSQTSTQASTLTWTDAAQQTTNSAYAFGHWFVQTETAKSDRSSLTFQTLQIHYTDWSGKEQIAWLLGDATQGYEFVIAQNNPPSPVDPSTCLSDGTCSVSQTIDYVGTDGNDYSATLPMVTGIPALPPGSSPFHAVNETLTASPAAPGTGQQVTFTASFPNPLLGGTVSFVSDLNHHDTTLCANVPVVAVQTVTYPNGIPTFSYNSSAAQCTATFTTPQSAVVYATFSPAAGSGFASAQASVPLNVTSKRATTTTVSSSAASPVVGQQVTLTATVADGTGGPVPAGTVTFSDGPGTLCKGVSLSSSAPYTATCPAAYSSPGQQTVTASYGGDAATEPSSGTFQFTVAKAATATTLSSTPVAPLFGQAVTFTASAAALAPSTNGPALGGTVTFTVDGKQAGAPVPLSGGSATSDSVTGLVPGAHTVVATYSGDSNYTGSSVTKSVTVACSTTISGTRHGALTVTGSTCVSGGRVTGAVTVAAGGALAVIHGTVQGTVSVSGAGAVLYYGTSTQNGNVSVSGGASLMVTGSTVDGTVTASGAGLVRYCATTEHGALSVSDTSGAVTLGDGGSCAGDTIYGAVTISGTAGAVSVSGLTQNGTLKLSGNRDGVNLAGTRLSGLAYVQSNTVQSNTVQSNGGTAANTVTANQINGSLYCTGNVPAPTDGGTVNTVTGIASSQCATLAVR